jgi:hypothetical protein
MRQTGRRGTPGKRLDVWLTFTKDFFDVIEHSKPNACLFQLPIFKPGTAFERRKKK